MPYAVWVNVIAPRTLRAFWQKHPNAASPLQAWLKDMQQGRYETPNQLREVYPSVDFVKTAGGSELTIFNIGGNTYRLVVFVRYRSQTVFIKRVMTHGEYDFWNKQRRP